MNSPGAEAGARAMPGSQAMRLPSLCVATVHHLTEETKLVLIYQFLKGATISSEGALPETRADGEGE